MDDSKFRNTLFAPWFALIVTALAAFIVYSNVYDCPFVFDDNHTIVKNTRIRDLSNFSSPGQFLEARAVVDFTFALNYRFGRLDVFGYHLVNILIHIVNGFVVYFLALAILRLLSREEGRGRRTEDGGQRTRERSSKVKGQSSKLKARGTKKKGKKDAGAAASKKAPIPDPRFQISCQQSTIPLVSLFAAIIFIVHPIQTQAVTYIVQRYASTAALFYMLSVLFYVQARVKIQSHPPSAFSLQPSAFFTLSAICGLLAFMSKQNTASLPGAIILVEYMCFGGMRRGWMRKLLWMIPAFILFTALILYIMNLFSGDGIGNMLEDVSNLTRETELVSRWSYLCTQFSVLVVYIRLLFLPVNQSLDYFYPFKAGFFDGLTPLAFAFLAGLVILAVWKRRKYPVITVTIFWFFITLSVESSIIPIRDALFEHRLYLPMFGFALLGAWLSFRLLSGKRALVVLICASIIVISLGTATYLRNRIWQDSVTLWADILAKSPQSRRACFNLGNALAKKKRYDDAIRCYSKVLKSDPDHASANNNMGIALEKSGDIDGAIRYYREALRVDPDHDRAHYNLGTILDGRGDLKGAARHYSEALRIRSGNVKVHNNLGVILFRLGDVKGALKNFRKAVRLDRGNAEARNNLGGVLATQGDFEGAAKHYSEALAIKPGYADAYMNLSRVLGRVKDTALAVRCYRKVLQSDTENADVHMNLGIALFRMDDLKGAVEHFSETIRINPQDAKAHYNLGLALYRQGKMDEAAKQYQTSLGIKPQNPKVHYSLALVLHRNGDFQGAVDHFEKTIHLDPRLKMQASYNIARAHARQGEKEKSGRWLEKAVEAGFNNFAGLETDPDLETIRDTLYYRKIMKERAM